MNQRQTRHTPARVPVAPLYRGPQATAAASATLPPPPYQHAPNAALLIDFDNVTMGIRSDLAAELRSLLSSEIIKGKVAVQRAYADWRRYPQYIVPLAESSIDMIMAPAYGSSKKNATDIRLAVDAIELVFTRPEIGTYILLSGDSDFASMVTKLKEYGKYVIGVGIRESSSDLLVMNCDEYYSYNALAGLVKQSDEEVVKWDPYELVVEAINRMVKNGDVMRSDRLKQVMQDIDPHVRREEPRQVEVLEVLPGRGGAGPHQGHEAGERAARSGARPSSPRVQERPVFRRLALRAASRRGAPPTESASSNGDRERNVDVVDVAVVVAVVGTIVVIATASREAAHGKPRRPRQPMVPVPATGPARLRRPSPVRHPPSAIRQTTSASVASA